MAQESQAENVQLLALLPLFNKTVVSAINLREFGYTKTQLMIFTALSRSDNLTMSQVAKYISTSKEQATRAVAPLVDDGLLERYVDPENRTKIHVRLTEKGRVFSSLHRDRFFRNLQTLMHEKLTAEEMLSLKQAAETMLRILSKLWN